jgi:DnaJ-class molecular chaperone
MTREVILCSNCGGLGVKHYQELTNHHKGEYETTTEPCRTCEGSGRMIRTTRVVVEPYRETKR